MMMRELMREEACEELVAWEGAARELGRQEAREQLPAAVAAAAEAAADAVAAADAAAQQLLDDEAGASWGKGKAKEWVRLTRRLLSLPSHGREVSSEQINTIPDAQHQRETEARGKPSSASICVVSATSTYARAETRSCLCRGILKT